MGTLPTALLRFARHSTDFGVRVLRGLVWPNVELAIRLWLAQIFFVSGAFKLTQWQAAKRISPASAPKSDSNINSAWISSDSIGQVLSESCAIGWPCDAAMSLAARNFARVPDHTPQPSPDFEGTYIVPDEL
jgi:hypothetical protein